jgi:hypothetical protein
MTEYLKLGSVWFILAYSSSSWEVQCQVTTSGDGLTMRHNMAGGSTWLEHVQKREGRRGYPAL